jgi:hypothetical protein
MSIPGSPSIQRTEVTYGQLGKVLRALGFKYRVLDETPPGRLYSHQKSGAWIKLPFFPDNEFVLGYHLAEVRTTLDGFGIADPTVFEAKLQKAG